MDTAKLDHFASELRPLERQLGPELRSVASQLAPELRSLAEQVAPELSHLVADSLQRHLGLLRQRLQHGTRVSMSEG